MRLTMTETSARQLPLSIILALPTFLRPPIDRNSFSDAVSRLHPTQIFVDSLQRTVGVESSSSSSDPSSSTSMGTDPSSQPTLPTFHIGSYRSALDLSKSTGRVLLVLLTSRAHSQDAAFKRTVLTDSSLIACLNRHDIVLWPGEVSEKEAYQVSRLFPPTTFPSLTFIGLLSPSPRPGVTSGTLAPKMSVLSRHEGAGVTAAELVAALEGSVVPRTRAAAERVRRERRLREEERRLREEQDIAFRFVSLHSHLRSGAQIVTKTYMWGENREAASRDSARILAMRRAAAESQSSAALAAATSASLALAAQNKLAYLRYARSHLIPEEPIEGGTMITLRVPPQRQPFRRRFAETSRLDMLHLWADTLSIPSDLRRSSDPTMAPGGYTHSWDFQLVTSYPRRIVKIDEGDGTIGGSLTIKSGGGVLVVEKLAQPGSNGTAAGEEREEDEEEDVDSD